MGTNYAQKFGLRLEGIENRLTDLEQAIPRISQQLKPRRLQALEKHQGLESKPLELCPFCESYPKLVHGLCSFRFECQGLDGHMVKTQGVATSLRAREVWNEVIAGMKQ